MVFDFVENGTVKDISVVPEQFRGLYAEDPATKVFKLKDDPATKGAVEAIVGLNKALRAERDVTKELRGRAVDLAPLSSYGKTPEEIAQKIRAEIETLQSKKVDVEAVKAEVAKGAASEIAKRESRIKALQEQLENLIIDQQITRAAVEHGADADLIMPHVRSRVRAVEEEGKLEARVFDDNGMPRYSANGNMTINELIADLKAQPRYQPLFKSETRSGSGARPGAAAGKAQPGPDKRTSVEKIAAGLARSSKAGV